MVILQQTLLSKTQSNGTRNLLFLRQVQVDGRGTLSLLTALTLLLTLLPLLLVFAHKHGCLLRVNVWLGDKDCLDSAFETTGLVIST